MDKAEVVFEKIALGYNTLLKAERKARRSRKLNEVANKAYMLLANSKLPMTHKFRMKLYDKTDKALALATKRSEQELKFLGRRADKKGDEVINKLEEIVNKLRLKNKLN